MKPPAMQATRQSLSPAGHSDVLSAALFCLRARAPAFIRAPPAKVRAAVSESSERALAERARSRPWKARAAWGETLRRSSEGSPSSEPRTTSQVYSQTPTRVLMDTTIWFRSRSVRAFSVSPRAFSAWIASSVPYWRVPEKLPTVEQSQAPE
eukprot:2204718-Rhodomonas_salina.2